MLPRTTIFTALELCTPDKVNIFYQRVIRTEKVVAISSSRVAVFLRPQFGYTSSLPQHQPLLLYYGGEVLREHFDFREMKEKTYFRLNYPGCFNSVNSLNKKPDFGVYL